MAGSPRVKSLLLAAAFLVAEFVLVSVLPPHKAVPLVAGAVGGLAHLFLLGAITDNAGWLEVIGSLLVVAVVSFAAHPICSTVS
jgi:hypothetical protein